MRAGEGELRLGGSARDDGAVVHLRSGRRQGEDAAEGKSTRHGIATSLQDVPGLTVIIDRGGHEFRAVDHRATTDCEQEIEFFLTDKAHRLHQRLVAGVRLDPVELINLPSAKCGANLGKRAVLPGAFATEQDQHARIRGDQRVKPRDRPRPKTMRVGLKNSKFNMTALHIRLVV
jgi:hypothetical protein